MLADSHPPDGFDQRMTGIPGVDEQTSLSKGAFGYCSSVAQKNTKKMSESQKEQVKRSPLKETKLIG